MPETIQETEGLQGTTNTLPKDPKIGNQETIQQDEQYRGQHIEQHTEGHIGEHTEEQTEQTEQTQDSDSLQDTQKIPHKSSKNTAQGKINKLWGENKHLKRELAEMKQMLQSIAKQNEDKQDTPQDIRTKIKGLTTAKAEAFEDRDYKKVSQIENQINDLNWQLQDITTQSKSNTNNDIDLRQRDALKAEKKFRKQHSWYDENSSDYNEEARLLALGISQQLWSADPDQDIDEVFDEVARRTESALGINGGSKMSSQSAQSLPRMGSTNINSGISNQKRTLSASPETIKMARNMLHGFGLTEAQILKEAQEIENQSAELHKKKRRDI